MSGPHLGQGMPADLSWITRKLEDQDRQIRELRAANTLDAATVGAGGITLTDSGSLTVKDSNGTVIAVIGALPSQYNRSDGTAQPGIALYREDGSIAAVLGDLNPTTPPYKQSLQLFDRAGNVLFADDTNSGVGIARPHLTVSPLLDTNVANWPATSATTWTEIARTWLEQEQPRLAWAIQLYAPANVTGQFRLMINETTQLGTTQTVVGGTSGTFATWQDTQPIGSTFSSLLALTIDAQVTAGTGTISAQQLYLQENQS